jgi:23S rRNA pseudouridine1911/1915/1917 synthase
MLKPIEILFEDYYLAVVKKPAGMVTDAADDRTPSVKQAFLTHLKQQYPERKKYIAGIPHRLDKPVSGLVIITKTPQALKHISRQFEERAILKKYHAWLQGHLPEQKGTLEHFTSRSSDGKKAIINDIQQAGDKACKLSYTAIKTQGDFTLAEIMLHTGRYHQIRAQFAHIGFPVAGDSMYGANGRNETGILLWCSSLQFAHPKTNEQMKVELPPEYLDHKL